MPSGLLAWGVPTSVAVHVADAANNAIWNGRLYSYEKVIRGVRVDGNPRPQKAVAGNTFRSFHRQEGALKGPMHTCDAYFLDNRVRIIEELRCIDNAECFHNLTNVYVEGLRGKLKDIVIEYGLDRIHKGQFIRSYGKVRKPVDIYLNSLVLMAEELRCVRCQLIPLLNLALDSQFFSADFIFTDDDLRKASEKNKGITIKRDSSFIDVVTECAYRYLQKRVADLATDLANHFGLPRFHPIYFELLWSDRYTRVEEKPTSLFELNPK